MKSDAVLLPSPDGWHPGDDQPWGMANQVKMIAALLAAAKKVKESRDRANLPAVVHDGVPDAS